MSEEKFTEIVEFDEKDEHRIWDGEEKKWYITDNMDSEPFSQWLQDSGPSILKNKSYDEPSVFQPRNADGSNFFGKVPIILLSIFWTICSRKNKALLKTATACVLSPAARDLYQFLCGLWLLTKNFAALQSRDEDLKQVTTSLNEACAHF